MTERRALDAYYTPDDLAVRLAGLLDIRRGHTVLEPHVGGGAWARAVRQVHPSAILHVTDIDPNAAGRGVDGAISLPAVDFTASNVGDLYDWIVGNPPFGAAETHVRLALSRAYRVAFLLRLAFLESLSRIDLWETHPPAEVHVLAKRPSFTGGGTDSAAYALFIWDQRVTTTRSRPQLSWVTP